MITIAVGDIHGCAAQLETLLTRVTDWANRHGFRETRLIFLGDLIDRGPDSSKVVATVRALQHEGAICLKGNHEQLMIGSAKSELGMQTFLKNGGHATLRSFGSMELFNAAREWMTELPTFWQDDLRYFVHAGIYPGEPLSEQSDLDRMWIRKPFLTHVGPFEKYIVHGHSPLFTNDVPDTRPEITPYRCNLDTGAVYGGALTAALFNDNQPAPMHTISV